MMRRRLKFAAVLVAVVLALTGFSSAAHGKSKGKGSGSSSSSGGGDSGGGGCSSSKKSNGSYSGSHRDHDDDDDDHGSSGGSYTGEPTPAATSEVQAWIVSCVSKAKGKRKAVTYATVTVEAPTSAGLTDTYDVDVEFRDASGSLVDTGDTEVALAGGESKTVKVRMDSPRQVSRVRKCEASAEVEV
ncbi:hypothetical protein GCM10009654_48430 [Streptomyces hebeiensis]|uniref:Secreted protein n=1 Tax=Streptomyces hebeiensis TaxID=229486 RepID=A0ABP4FJH2_9ACTN